MSTLTTKQKKLVKELEQLYELLSLDFYNIKSYPKQRRTVLLELMQRAAARQEVVSAYTHVDEYLASELCVHFFGTERNFGQLWKTKKFRLFNAHFIEELSLMPKFRYVKALKAIPKAIGADIERLNALRNAVAHSFFPENVKKSQAKWKGQSIFTQAGIERFCQDLHVAKTFFEHIRRDRY